MDEILKGINQDFKLTPYKVLACSRNDGYMEFVPMTTTLQAIIKQYKGDSLITYFKELSKNPDNILYKDYPGYKNAFKRKELEEKIK